MTVSTGISSCTVLGQAEGYVKEDAHIDPPQVVRGVTERSKLSSQSSRVDSGCRRNQIRPQLVEVEHDPHRGRRRRGNADVETGPIAQESVVPKCRRTQIRSQKFAAPGLVVQITSPFLLKPPSAQSIPLDFLISYTSRGRKQKKWT